MHQNLQITYMCRLVLPSGCSCPQPHMLTSLWRQADDVSSQTCWTDRPRLQVATEPDYRFELAVHLGELDTALQIAQTSGSEAKWRQLGELALAAGKLEVRPLSRDGLPDAASQQGCSACSAPSGRWLALLLGQTLHDIVADRLTQLMQLGRLLPHSRLLGCSCCSSSPTPFQVATRAPSLPVPCQALAKQQPCTSAASSDAQTCACGRWLRAAWRRPRTWPGCCCYTRPPAPRRAWTPCRRWRARRASTTWSSWPPSSLAACPSAWTSWSPPTACPRLPSSPAPTCRPASLRHAPAAAAGCLESLAACLSARRSAGLLACAAPPVPADQACA